MSAVTIYGVVAVTFPQPWNGETAPIAAVLAAMARRLEERRA